MEFRRVLFRSGFGGGGNSDVGGSIRRNCGGLLDVHRASPGTGVTVGRATLPRRTEAVHAPPPHTPSSSLRSPAQHATDFLPCCAGPVRADECHAGTAAF